MLGLPLAMLVKTSLLAKFAKHLDHPIQRDHDQERQRLLDLARRYVDDRTT